MRRARDFNPRAPCGARRFVIKMSVITREFQPTRPLRGATVLILLRLRAKVISTHAPLAGRDFARISSVPLV